MHTYTHVKMFMISCGQNEKGFGSQSDLYFKLIEEEFNELKEAYKNKDIVEIADACADLRWVIEGLETTLEIPNQRVWEEVKRSNFSKIGPSGKVERREDGKILKPDTYSAPNIKQFFDSL